MEWNKKSEITVMVLALLMAFVMMPMIGGTAYSAAGDPGIVAGSQSVLEDTANTDSAQTVLYAGHNWRVISYGDTGNGWAKIDGVMTLFSVEAFGNRTQFNNVMDENHYKGSILQSKVDAAYDTHFSKQEKATVIKRTLIVDETPRTSCGVAGEETEGYLWPLSLAEALDLPSNNFRAYPDVWWLRSPGLYKAGSCVTSRGEVQPSDLVVNAEYVRPAFWLDLGSGVF